jgi:hypothetical protein
MKNKKHQIVNNNNNNNNNNNKIAVNKGVIVEKKLEFFKEVIEKTLFHINKNKLLGIISIVDVNISTNKLCELSNIVKELITNTDANIEIKINALQNINNELSSLIKNYGTYSLNDLLVICFGNDISNKNDLKFDLLQKYFHPISYKILNKVETEVNKNFDCVDITSNNNFKQFYVKVHGINLHVYNGNLKKAMIVHGIVDDILLDLLYDNTFLTDKIENIKKNVPNESKFHAESFDRFISSLVLKDFFPAQSRVKLF